MEVLHSFKFHLFKQTLFYNKLINILTRIIFLLLQKTQVCHPVLPVSGGYDSESLLIVCEDSRTSRILTSAPLPAPHDVFNKKTLRGPTKGHWTQQWLPGQQELSHHRDQCRPCVFVYILTESSRGYLSGFTLSFKQEKAAEVVKSG